MERYLTDEEGHRTAVVLPIDEYEALIEAQEELSDIAAHDEVDLTRDDGQFSLTPLQPPLL